MGPDGIGLIKGLHGGSTFAHEAGHFLRNIDETGKWKNLGHTHEVLESEDIKMLMRDDGGGWKIPFDIMREFRKFFDRYPGMRAAGK